MTMRANHCALAFKMVSASSRVLLVRDVLAAITSVPNVGATGPSRFIFATTLTDNRPARFHILHSPYLLKFVLGVDPFLQRRDRWGSKTVSIDREVVQPQVAVAQLGGRPGNILVT